MTIGMAISIDVCKKERTILTAPMLEIWRKERTQSRIPRVFCRKEGGDMEKAQLPSNLKGGN
ncbi:MAG: hypothetical protein NTZ10_01305 [Candidatus Saganbacteria bacterium]|nr:hypothetical protein [Candidatus Saganbacteria bacterium]